MSKNNTGDIFDRFGESARKVLTSAQGYADSTNNNLGSEHILIALAESRGTLSFDILKEYLVSADQIRLLMADSKNASKNNGSKLQESGKSVIKRAVLAAAEYNHISVDSEHLLLGCVSDKKLKSYKLITQLGVDPEKISVQLHNLFNDLSEMDEVIRSKIENDNEARSFLTPDDPMDTANTTKKKKTKFPAIEYFTINLTDLAKKGKLDSVVGRKAEIERALRSLVRRTKNNPVFIGEPGIGKTAIVEGIAQLIVAKKTPDKLNNKQILMLDLPLLLAGTMYRGQFEERIKKLIDEINKRDDIILFVDEIHTIVGAGSAEGSIDAANILKPALARGKIRLIGATTTDEYRKNIEKDPALERRLQPILIEEPAEDETIKMIKGLKPKYEEYHNVEILDEAIIAATQLSNRYISDRFLPDKAIDIIDESCAYVSLKNSPSKKSGKNLNIELKNIKKEKETALSKGDFEKAYKLKQKESKTRNAIKNDNCKVATKKYIVSKNIIADILSQWTGIPSTQLLKEEIKSLANIENKLSQYIIGQEYSIKEVSQAIRRNRTGVADSNRPIGSFVFLGPSGVGKTELAKVLAKEVYGSSDSLIKIDMSEFMERHNSSRLVGAPPGYVGFEEAGKLTEAIRRKPYSIVLFDEIEKAHQEFFNLLLQILDEGYLTDAKGRKVNFRNSIIIMTSNIGLKEVIENRNIGFSNIESYETVEQNKRKLIKALNSHMRPEFINRIDRIVVFNSLSKENLQEIARLELNKLKKRLYINNKIVLTYDDNILDWIINIDIEKKYGARPIKRIIQNYIENIIADTILRNYDCRDINLSVRNKKVIARIVSNQKIAK